MPSSGVREYNFLRLTSIPCQTVPLCPRPRLCVADLSRPRLDVIGRLQSKYRPQTCDFRPFAMTTCSWSNTGSLDDTSGAGLDRGVNPLLAALRSPLPLSLPLPSSPFPLPFPPIPSLPLEVGPSPSLLLPTPPHIHLPFSPLPALPSLRSRPP